jgi:hypothetical protein
MQVEAQIKPDTSFLRKKLETIFESDQSSRINDSDPEIMHLTDSLNLIEVESIISQYGWLGKSMIGSKANVALFLVIQHSNLETQKKYYPLLEKSVLAGESRPSDQALMLDRILMWSGKKQIYGTQLVPDDNGGLKFYPIENELEVNQRRKQIGLSTIEEYAKIFNLEYHPAK